MMAASTKDSGKRGSRMERVLAVKCRFNLHSVAGVEEGKVQGQYALDTDLGGA